MDPLSTWPRWSNTLFFDQSTGMGVVISGHYVHFRHDTLGLADICYIVTLDQRAISMAGAETDLA
jgi:hypothetical protein